MQNHDQDDLQDDDHCLEHNGDSPLSAIGPRKIRHSNVENVGDGDAKGNRVALDGHEAAARLSRAQLRHP